MNSRWILTSLCPSWSDVQSEQPDGGLRLHPGQVPHRGRRVPGPGLHAGGGGADGQDAGQEQRVLRQLDTKQHQDRGLRHPAQRKEIIEITIGTRSIEFVFSLNLSNIGHIYDLNVPRMIRIFAFFFCVIF